MFEPSRNRANGCWRGRTKLEKKLILCGSVLTVIVILLFSLNSMKRSCHLTSDDECTTKYCVKAASELLEFIDTKVDPCQNFYDFVCGHYYKKAVKKGSPSPINKITHEYQNEMKSIMVNPISKKDTNSNKLIKQFYHECMNQTKIDLNGNQALMTAINALGGWPLLNGSNWNESSFDWVDWHIKSKQLGIPIFGFFTFLKVESTDNDTVLKITGPSAKSKAVSNSKLYNIVMNMIVGGLGGNFSQEENEDVFKFMIQLRKLNFSPPFDEEVGTVQDLIEECPSVPWLKLLNGIAGNRTKFSNSSDVAFSTIKSYCKSLISLVNSTKPRTLANYYIWSMIHQMYPFTSRGIRYIYTLLDDPYRPRYQTCSNETDSRFKFVKEVIYIRSRTPEIVKKQLTEMIDIMKEVFIEHLRNCDWMDEETKDFALNRTRMIDSIIGGTEDLYDEEAFDAAIGLDGFNFTSDNIFRMVQEKRIRETQHFFKTLYGPQKNDLGNLFTLLTKLNAFFAQSLNMMILPAPILSSIFYDYRKPAFMNYGSLGRIIGHEIMHGFEESAREIMIDDENVVDWWGDETAAAYHKKTQCAVDDYEKVPFRYKLNGTLTLDENVSDLVGIDVAYEAYLKYIEKYGVEKRLPGVPLTPKQIYWVQTGTFLCFRKLDDDETDLEQPDEHGIPAFRVQAGARNSKYFAKDFDCPVDSLMNPKDKCRIL